MADQNRNIVHLFLPEQVGLVQMWTSLQVNRINC